MKDMSAVYIIVVVIAFIAGYSIVSFIVRFFKKTSKAEGTETSQKQQSNNASSYASGEKDERYYAKVLGFHGPVTIDDVKRQYKELISQYHPDKANHLGPELKKVAEQKTKEINEAYEYFKKKYRIS
jgi:hypothetical protein